MHLCRKLITASRVLHPHYRGQNGRVISLQMRQIACKTGYAKVTKTSSRHCLPPLDVKIGSCSRPFPTHPCLIAMCERISHVHTNQSSLVRPNNCSLKSPLCAAVCTRGCQDFFPLSALFKWDLPTLAMMAPNEKYSLIDEGLSAQKSIRSPFATAA